MDQQNKVSAASLGRMAADHRELARNYRLARGPAEGEAAKVERLTLAKMHMDTAGVFGREAKEVREKGKRVGAKVG